MKNKLYIFALLLVFSCKADKSEFFQNNPGKMKKTEIRNETINNHQLLSCMYEDDYFPNFLVDKCKNILMNFCEQIELTNPKDLKELYRLSHDATNDINDLQEEFDESGSEIETGARECLAENFEFIAITYGFKADIEELIGTRDW
mgnify:CR=1 FL=1